MATLNLSRTIEIYIGYVRTLRETRKFLSAHKELSEQYLSLPKQTLPDTTYKVMVSQHGDLGKKIAVAHTKLANAKWELQYFRRIMLVVQCIKHDRLTEYEQELLLRFLSNPREETEYPTKLLGLGLISPKLLCEVLAQKLYKR